MLKSLTQAIQARAKGVRVVVLLIITLAVYDLMLVSTIPTLMSYAGNMPILDMLPRGYSAAYVHSLFVALGDQGRYYYLSRQIPIDLVYPALFAVTFALTLAWVFRRAIDPTRRVNLVILVPLAAGLCDYAENTGIIIMLTRFPDFSSALATTTSVFTVAKSLFTSLTFILLIVGGIQIGRKWLRDRRAGRRSQQSG